MGSPLREVKGLHIVQLVSRFPPIHIGGIENAVYHISRELVRKGHEVTVITSSDSWSRVVEEIDGIAVRRLPCLFKLGYTSPFLPSFLLDSGRVGSFDIVHAHVPDGFLSASSPLLSMVRSSPLVLTVHNFPLGESSSKLVLSRVLEQLLRIALLRSSRVFVHNSSYALTSRLRGLEGKVCVTPLGVDLARFNPECDGCSVRSELGLESNSVILFVSVLDRAHWYKGLRLLLNSMRHLNHVGRDARLVVVGSGDTLAEYRDYAEKIGVEKQVIFVGRVEDSMLPKYYASSDLVVLPSTGILEGFGLVAAEAMASGKATIVSRIAGISEYLTDGYDAIVLENLSEYALAETISDLLQDSKRRNSMGKKARKTAEANFNWSKITERMLREYERVARII